MQKEANKKIMTKLPAKLFCDFERGGGLTTILNCALRYKNEQVSKDRIPIQDSEPKC